jgi:preprotein translocase subunit SecG
MEIIKIMLIVVEVICGLLLIGVILIQPSKSQGMGMAFGGGMGETLFGSRAGNVLTKITVILGLVFLANTALLGILFTSGDERSLIEKAAAPAPLPVANQGGGMLAPPAEPSSQGTLFPTVDEAPAAPEQSAEVMPVEIPSETVAPAAPVDAAAPVEETAAP